METQIIAEYEVRPAGIVEQLLEIAEKYDCMSEIGNATSWRWKEGIITRMPKTKTVARILKAAFNTNEPDIWFSKVEGDLKKFIKNSFELSYGNLSFFEPKDIYEASCYMSLSDGRGVKLEELVNRLATLKFAINMDFTEDFQEYDPEAINKLHSSWALAKAKQFLENFDAKADQDGFFTLGVDTTNSTEALVYFINEINALQSKVMRFCSHFDMWSYFNVALTDSEMIDLEKELITTYKNFLNRVEHLTNFNGRNKNNMRTRVFSFSAISLNNKVQEELTWKN